MAAAHALLVHLPVGEVAELGSGLDEHLVEGLAGEDAVVLLPQVGELPQLVLLKVDRCTCRPSPVRPRFEGGP